MILAGQLLMADDAGRRCELVPGWVRVEGDQIAEVAKGEPSCKSDFGSKQALISPGFIDAHLHLAQFDMIGAHGLPLLSWLSEYAFPAELKWRDAEYARRMTQRVIGELFSVGTTGIGAFATVHHEAAAAALEVASQMGMRGAIGQVLMDREAPAELCRDRQQLLEEATRLSELFPSTARMAAAVTPRFAITCSEELLSGAGRLACETGAMVQSHLAETRAECEYVQELFPGRSYVEVYRQAGLLGGKSVFAHGIHLDRQQRLQLCESRTAIAHCPTANTFLRSGAMDRAGLLHEGVIVAVGSDIGGGYERSMVRVARAMIETAAAKGDDIPGADAGWYAITAGNADALRWLDGGRLRAHAPADLLVIEPTIPWLDSPADPLATLMFAWDDRWLSKTIVRGECMCGNLSGGVS